MSLTTRDNHAIWFRKKPLAQQTLSGHTLYTREEGNPYSFGELVKNNSSEVYTLTNPDGSKSIFDGDGLLRSRKDRLDNILREYDYNGEMLDTITDISGRITKFSDDGYGHITSITDFYDTPEVQQTTYLEYDNNAALGGRLIKVTEPDPDGTGPLSSPITNYEYYTSGDAANLLKSVIDPRGLRTAIEYDSTRHVSEITERCGGTIEIESIPSFYADAMGTTGTSPANLARARLERLQRMTMKLRPSSIGRSLDATST